MFDQVERAYLESARVGRLATVDGSGRPNVVPVCFALVESPGGDLEIVTPIDEKPKAGSPETLRRSRDIRDNPFVSLVVDEYTETWSDLGWVQIRGRATLGSPGGDGHELAIGALRAKYDQYESHALKENPVIQISPGSVLSWGSLDPQ